MEMTHDDCGRFEYNSDLQINDIAKRKSNVTGILETDGPTMLTRNFLIALPLLSVAYAQGTAAGADSGQVPLTDRDPLGGQEYHKVCLSPTNTEVEIAPGTLAQYYCDRQPQHWNDKVAGAESIEACALACTDIETCKGTFWKSKDGTCWWSD
ncbi:unnamed protein product [Aspergillus oryzae]|nr:unnamed protein product [Aspergillus oryzae]GMF94719.1 unnamed protein product [Aspergillus oryzae]